MNKVYGGTSKDDHLCPTCSNVQQITYPNQVVTICHMLTHSQMSPVITDRVVECNEYRHKDEPSKVDFEKIAWHIEAKNGRFIGFKRPEPEKE